MNPPVRSQKQELPFGELTWEDFEKLCLRLVRLNSEVEFCQQYGGQGDAQDGIDIFARKYGDDKYSVYQCKRERTFGPAKIHAAIERFEKGKWKSRSSEIVLCTQGSLQKKKLIDVVVAHQERLKSEGITFLPWDCHQLSIKLKDCPDLVYDFFGPYWLKHFCGDEIAVKYQHRLSLQQVGEFRKKLGVFYKTVFNTQDPGLPLVPNQDSIAPDIQQRFVVPDVIEWDSLETSTRNPDPQPQASDPGYYFDNQNTTASSPTSVSKTHSARVVGYRINVEKWLLHQNRSLLLGDPGSGKTTLLRYIAMDLLQPSPKMELLSQKWGCFLPVWIPFALWTRLVSKHSDTSLMDVLKYWLRGFNEEGLLPIIEAALHDERLLLFVDGLDEWINEDAAQLALTQLKVFVEQRNVPVVATSRPRAIERLTIPTNGWSLGRIADFSFDQQTALVAVWFEYSNSHRPVSSNDHNAEAFIAELRRSHDLKELAKSPLMLLFLIYHRIHRSALPEGRFKAYESIINHLISSQPKKRRLAANIVEDKSPIPTDDLVNAFARIAFEIQLQKATGTILKSDARQLLVSYLMDDELGHGLGKPQAREISDRLLEFGQEEAGLMVYRSNDEIGFYHRTFHEYLAAYHLSQLPLESQIRLVGTECQNPQWHESILCLFQLTRKKDDSEKLVAKLEQTAITASASGQKSIESILAEVAFSDLGCPPKTAKRIAESLYRVIERGDWMPHRERLLGLAIDGIRSTTMKESVKKKLTFWFPGRVKWRAPVIEATANWEWTDELNECLWNNLHDSDFSNQRAAAKVICEKRKGDEATGVALSELASYHPRASVRVASLEGLMLGWPSLANTEAAMQIATDSLHPQLQLLGLFWRIKNYRQNDEDKKLLLRLSRWQTGLYEFRALISEAIVTGWPKDTDFKQHCMDAVAGRNHLVSVDKTIATSVLLNGYQDDTDVVALCAKEMSSDHPFILTGLADAIASFSNSFPRNKELMDSVDTWLERQKFNGPDEMKAALYTKSERARKKLLRLLSEDGTGWRFWAAEGLLQGWPGDPEALEQLRTIAKGENKYASGLSMQLSRIIADREECIRRLIEFMDDDSVRRHDLVVRAIVELEPIGHGFDLVDMGLSKVIPKLGVGNMDVATITATLIKRFPDDARVQLLVHKCLAGRIDQLSKPSLSLIASCYPRNREIQNKILAIMSPLPDPMRLVLVERLGSIHSEQHFVETLLSNYDDEFHGEVKTTASIAYHQALLTSGNSSAEAIINLKEGITCYGPDHEARRQAAFCGLTILKRLDVMTEAAEPTSDNRPFSINLIENSTYGTNVPLVQFILSNWTQIRLAFGDTFWRRLSKSEVDASKWQDFWNFLDQYPEPRAEAIEFIESHQQVLDIAGIKFVERLRPKSDLLLRHCFRILKLGDDSIDVAGVPAILVSEVLGANFGASAEVLEHVKDSCKHRPLYGKEVLALCCTWPSHDLLRGAYEHMRNGAHYPEEVAIRLAGCVGTSEEIEAWIDLICQSVRLPTDSIVLFARPIVQRAASDGDLVGKLIGKLETDSERFTHVSILKTLAAAVGLNSELLEWCDSKLANRHERAQVGVDVFTGQFISLQHAILEVRSASPQIHR